MRSSFIKIPLLEISLIAMYAALREYAVPSLHISIKVICEKAYYSKVKLMR
jgi:hypothetical protein